MNDQLKLYLILVYGATVTILYAGAGLFLWFYNDKIKLLPAQVNPLVVGVLVVYGVFRLVRSVQTFIAARKKNF